MTGNQIEKCTFLGCYAVSNCERSSQLLRGRRLKSHMAIRLVTGVQFPEKAEIFPSAATSLVAWNAATLLSTAYMVTVSSFSDKAARQ